MECEFQYAEPQQPIHPTDWTALARGFCDGRGGPVMVAPSRGKACNESLGSASLEVGQADGGAPGLLGDRLLREEARRGEHAHAAVGQLALAVPVHLQLRLALEEAGRVEVNLLAADGVEVAREAVRERRLGGRRLLAAAELHLR